MREVEEAAIEKTRLASKQRATEKRKRRMAERRNGWTGVHSKSLPVDDVPVSPSLDDEDDIQPFTDIQLG